jgi:hypothetical protein
VIDENVNFKLKPQVNINNLLPGIALTIRSNSLVLKSMSRLSIKQSIFLLLVLFAFALKSPAQDLTGIWRGYFITESFDQYKFELQIKQNTSSISGVSYSYLSTVFYGKATLTGTFNKSGKSALIREIKTVELKMSGGSNACIMRCVFSYEKSGKEEFLEGTFTSKFEKNGFGAKKGENCGGGKVYLRKVTTSDFYIEPFLRPRSKTNPVATNKAPIKDTLKTKINPPVVKKPATTTNKPVITSKPVVKPGASNTTTKTNTGVTKTNQPAKQKIDSVQKLKEPADSSTAIKKVITTPNVLKTRENELFKVFTITNPEVSVKLYDNGEIDDDTISVYLDKKLVLSKKRLTAVPLSLKFKMDESDPNHELIMVAENLGRIPPNTSLMIVESGEQRFEVRITSTEQKNALVRFRYEKPKLP